MHISIVIPALNEARCIEQTLWSLSKQEPPFDAVVVDGGSEDETRELAGAYAEVVAADRGRALQMNAGAIAARGDVLLFLHADTLLPDGALASIRKCCEQCGAESGIFRLKFDYNTPLLRFYSFCTRFRHPRFCFGDRALFVRKHVFEELGGFASIPIFEDLDMSRKLYQRGRFVFLDDYVTTAARRFRQNGPFRQQLLNSYLWFRYLLGASPDALARHYSYTSVSGCEQPSEV